MDAGELRRVTWVCGDQRVLVEEVVDTVKARLGAHTINYESLSYCKDFDRVVWSAAHQYPAGGGTRLVLVRDAERLRRWEPLPGWLAAGRTLPGVYLLFVSGDPDLPYLISAGKRTQRLLPHVDAMKAPRGHVVRCTMPNEVDAIAWVTGRARLDTDTAAHLLMRTGGNLTEAAAVCAKLALFPGTAGRSTIEALCAQRPALSFVDSLLHRRKRDALACLPGLDPSDYGKLIGQLDHRLDTLTTLWRAQTSGMGTGQMVRSSGVPTFLIRSLLPIAKHYDPRRAAYSRHLLAVVDDAYRCGARDAVMEALVALW